MARQRTVDPKGTDKGAAKEIEDDAKRRKVFASLEPAPPKFSNPFKQAADFVRGVTRRINSSGNNRSPSTTHDSGAASGAPVASTTLTDAERERIARKYVDR